MPSWLSTSLSSNADLSPMLLCWRIGVALVLGGAVAGLHRWARRGEVTPATFTVTLVLLAGLIAMATQIIGDNIARAFSLVGALQVVRFRTVVKDTQDTAFVIMAVVAGMASGASHLAVALVGLTMLVLIAPVLWPTVRGDAWCREEGTLRLKVEGGAAPRAAVEGVFRTALLRHRLLSAATAKKGAALELSYAVRLNPGGSPIDLVGELNRIEGVSGVEIAREE
jgi:Domain of unknown function (DUF4956)